MNNTDQFTPAFYRTRDGFLAARVGELALLAIPAKTSGLRVATAYTIDKPPEEWSPTDLYGVSRLVDDEFAFRRYVEEIAEHKRQLLTLDRPEIRTNAPTPWGAAQISRAYR